jgi:diadenosine tetraphosphate (Ap4A) HIT family hydrolase
MSRSERSNGVYVDVAAARESRNRAVLGRACSGWFVMADVQILPGKCLLLSDPVVRSINDLTADARGRFLLDMIGLGDALLRATDANRVNYEILGNSDPVLHAHVTARYASEPEERRKSPAWFYDLSAATHFDPDKHGALQARIARALTELGLLVGDTQHVV